MRAPPGTVATQMSRKGRLYHLRRLIFWASPALAEALGIDFRIHAPHRRFLEQQVFGVINARLHGQPNARCLSIGIHKYTWHYPRLLACELHTIDYDASRARYGQAGLHTTGSALELDKHYPAGSFPVVLVNGVVGFGIDSEDGFNQLMAQVATGCTDDALVVLGYNNRPDRLSFAIEHAAGLALFEPVLPPIAGLAGPAHEIDDGHRHRYLFLRKAA